MTIGFGVDGAPIDPHRTHISQAPVVIVNTSGHKALSFAAKNLKNPGEAVCEGVAPELNVKS
jgi:hypothetical protein